MDARRPPRPPDVSRRGFLALAAAAVGVAAGGALAPARGGTPARRLRVEDLYGLPPFERLHAPDLRLPVLTINGDKVPIVVEMTHPMTPDHRILSVHVVNPRDPVPSKGIFHFTPANGQVYLAFQARIDQGVSEVSATAECNRDGRWSSVGAIRIPEGAGGCAVPAPPRGAAGIEIRPPVLRIPQLVKRGRIRRDEIIDVQLKMRHPNRTGLAFRDGRFVQESEPFHLTELEVFHGAERVSRFELTSALSDDPFITFRLRARSEDPIRVVLANTRGERFEASHELRLS